MDSGDPRENPRLRSGPFILSTITFIAPYRSRTAPRKPCPFLLLFQPHLIVALEIRCLLVSPTKLKVPQGQKGLISAQHRTGLRSESAEC